jgi:shikimate dehydrogenase
MIKAAVLGSPISHSLSPLLHMAAYKELGLKADYQAIDLSLENAPAFFDRARKEEWTGFSLTMPLKESVFNSGFELEPVALQMRSVNTLLFQKGNFSALSTDRTAFIRLLENVKKQRVAIIGGGGTARAALSALDSSSVSVDVLLRSEKRAEILKKIATKSELTFFDMNHDLQGYDLVISTVPADASSLVASKGLSKESTFFEVLYNPFPTAGLKSAQDIGCQVIDGMQLLVEQALDQIHLFSAADFNYDQMRTHLLGIGRAQL